MALNLQQPFLPEHGEYCFRRATCSTSGAESRWVERASNPMTDYELKDALEYELGIEGGGGSPDKPCYRYKSAGLKIWGSWEYPNPYTCAPLWQGVATISEARRIYGIHRPSDGRQMSLFGDAA